MVTLFLVALRAVALRLASIRKASGDIPILTRCNMVATQFLHLMKRRSRSLFCGKSGESISLSFAKAPNLMRFSAIRDPANCLKKASGRERDDRPSHIIGVAITIETASQTVFNL